MSSCTVKAMSSRKKVDNLAHGDVKRLVLDAAIAIIADEGPDALSMREVARRANISHQAPYHHYIDRAGIFAAIAEEGFRIFSEQFRSTLHSTTQPLNDCLRAYVKFAFGHQGHFKVMFRSDICGITSHEATRRAADDAFLVLLDFAARVDPREKTPSESIALPVLLWSQAHGLATLLIDGPLVNKLPPEVSVDQLIDTVGELIANAMSTTASGRLRQPAHKSRPK